jgi:nucleotide-binding universal stress UspA family protein
MKILVAVDQNAYSAYAVDEAARLARNTLANVTLLGVSARTDSSDPRGTKRSGPWNRNHPLTAALSNYRESFLAHFGGDDSPYATTEFGYELVEVRKGVWELLRVCRGAKKEFKTRMRSGAPVKQILAECEEEAADLVVLGCSADKMCDWDNDAGVPQKIANDAPCSVLVAKEEKSSKKVVCCLDQNTTSQESLEMINQMVTIHDADLEIVGITEADGGLRIDVDRKMNTILKYYRDRRIDPFIKLVPLTSLDSFVSEESRQGLVALWVGEKSILSRVFPRTKVNRLIKASGSSVLMLR